MRCRRIHLFIHSYPLVSFPGLALGRTCLSCVLSDRVTNLPTLLARIILSPASTSEAPITNSTLEMIARSPDLLRRLLQRHTEQPYVPPYVMQQPQPPTQTTGKYNNSMLHLPFNDRK
jgi:hypothetical protein